MALIVAQMLGTLLFFGMFRLPETPWSSAIVSRFFPQADLYSAVFVGLALDAGFRSGRRLLALAARGLAAATVIYVAVNAIPLGPSIGRTAIEAHARAALDSVAPGGVLIGSGDSFIAAMWERQVVHGQRPDVTFVAGSLLPAPWYAERIRHRTGYVHPERMAGISRLVAHLHQAGVPVYLSEAPPASLAARFHFVPKGIVLQILPLDASPPPAPWVEEREAAFFTRHPVPSLLPWQRIRTEEKPSLEAFIRPWRALCATYERAGDQARLARCRTRLESVTLQALGAEAR